ncbi:MAG: diheme cytochrome c [Candidatus Thiodiazotropha sp. (ex Epidulcina cf. delphinae)]|nr:diheme cytochrome c [Candidatus Thiodiazotropha sp. (ex Epidulcina cf. delphinae)]
MKHRSSIASGLALSAALLGLSGAAFGDDDGYDFFARMWVGSKAPGVAPVTDTRYLEECGGCHFPYQPGLLPARSWTKLMTDLEQHFGENAELPADDAERISDFLVNNAADQANYKRSRKIMRSLRPGETPLAVSETPYFIKKHDELSRKMVQDNPRVESISRCEACHTRAETGSFGEEEILIPGFGAWEDD